MYHQSCTLVIISSIWQRAMRPESWKLKKYTNLSSWCFLTKYYTISIGTYRKVKQTFIYSFIHLVLAPCTSLSYFLFVVTWPEIKGWVYGRISKTNSCIMFLKKHWQFSIYSVNWAIILFYLPQKDFFITNFRDLWPYILTPKLC